MSKDSSHYSPPILAHKKDTNGLVEVVIRVLSTGGTPKHQECSLVLELLAQSMLFLYQCERQVRAYTNPANWLGFSLLPMSPL